MNAAGHAHVEESTNFLKTAIYLYNIDLAKPKSEALVGLFSSPSLYWIKTVIKLFSTDCRRVSSRGFRDQGPVVRRRISANTRLNFNLDFFTPLFESLFGIISSILYRASNHQILIKKNYTEFLLKLLDLKSEFTPTLGYLNPALNNPAQSGSWGGGQQLTKSGTWGRCSHNLQGDQQAC